MGLSGDTEKGERALYVPVSDSFVQVLSTPHLQTKERMIGAVTLPIVSQMFHTRAISFPMNSSIVQFVYVQLQGRTESCS